MQTSKIQATPRNTPRTDKQISPPVRCFCCQDSGLISNIYLGEFVEIPDRGDILPYICQRANCDKGQAHLNAYNMSDQERDTWHNNQTRGKDGDNIPKPMRAYDYRANFSTNLNQGCCDWLHERSYSDWVTSIQSPRQKVDIATKFIEAQSHRHSQIEDIKDLLMTIDADISDRLSTFTARYREKNNILYRNWEDLPTEAHAKLIINIRNLSA